MYETKSLLTKHNFWLNMKMVIRPIQYGFLVILNYKNVQVCWTSRGQGKGSNLCCTEWIDQESWSWSYDVSGYVSFCYQNNAINALLFWIDSSWRVWFIFVHNALFGCKFLCGDLDIEIRASTACSLFTISRDFLPLSY